MTIYDHLTKAIEDVEEAYREGMFAYEAIEKQWMGLAIPWTPPPIRDFIQGFVQGGVAIPKPLEFLRWRILHGDIRDVNWRLAIIRKELYRIREVVGRFE